MAGHTLFFFSSKTPGIRRSKAPACPYAARRLFAERIKRIKSGALELMNDKGETLEEFATPDEFWVFQTIGSKEAAERQAERAGRPMPEPTIWRKTYRV